MGHPIIHVVRDADVVAQQAADIVGEVVRAHPTAVLALPTGRTPIELYQKLGVRHRRGELSFAHTQIFNLDEWVGVAPASPGSYARFMEEHFYAHVDVPAPQRHIPNGLAPNLGVECERYEKLIRQSGGIDLAVLGIGSNGHIGFNEPGTPEDSCTHVVLLSTLTRRANAYAFPRGQVPHRAITMGIGTILDARQILLLAVGSTKANALTKALFGNVTPSVPASFLQHHANVTVIADTAAAMLFPRSSAASYS